MDEWNTVIRTNGGAVQDYTISYQNLDPSRTYYFRVLAYNEFGISEPCTTDKTVRDEVFDKISPGEIEISAKLHRNLKKSSKFGLNFFVVPIFREQITAIITGCLTNFPQFLANKI